MTRDERTAISILNAYKEGYESAMEDYKQQPCEDAVSREAALKEAYSIVIDGDKFDVVQVETLLGLPSVTVRRSEITLESAIDYLHKIGWMQEHDRILSERQTGKCSTCKHYMQGERDGSCDSYVCQHYSDWEGVGGADMRGAENG